MPNSSSASDASFITTQSESLPMTSPTSGSDVSTIDVSSQEGGRVDGPRAYVLSMVAEGRHVTHLSPWADDLSVHVDVHAGIMGHAVQIAAVHLGDVAA